MRIERTKNATRNIFWGIVEKLISILLPFILRTVMIKVMGEEYLGLNSLFTSILSVLSITELGIGSAIVFSMYRPIAEDDNETMCALLNLYRKIYYVIGTIILVAGLLILPALPFLIKGDHPADINLYALYLIFLSNTVLSYYLFGYKTALFSAYQRNDLLSKRTALVNLISEVLKIGALIAFHNYYIYALIIPLATVANNLINAYLAKKMYPDIVCRGKISDEMKSGIKKRIVGLISFKIYGVVFNSVDTIVISSFLGLTPLAIYNNYYYVQTSISGFLVILTTSITAGIGNKMVTNSKEENYVDLKKFSFANAWITSWCSICLLCLYQHFMELWVGSNLVFPFFTMVLMVLYFFLPKISCLTFTFREAAGLWWEDRFRPLVATAVNLVLNIALVKVIGMDGVIISTLVCTVCINIPWGTSILFKKYFERSPKEFFMQIGFYTLITAIVGTLTYLVCMLLPKTGFFSLIGKGAICVIFPNLLFLLIYRKMPEFKYMESLIKRIFGKFTKKIGKS